MLDPVAVDMLRAAHLSLFAAGMGTGLYHDFLTFRTLGEPISRSDVQSIEHLHTWITAAFAGLWVTGLALIYVRTSFDITAFSPKLWVKVSLMALMTLNARMICLFVLPMMRKNIGRSLLKVDARDLVISTQIAITSMFGWTAGMVLGSSTYLKTAPWEVLLPVAMGWFVICTVAGQGALWWMRARAHAADTQQDQLMLDLG